MKRPIDNTQQFTWTQKGVIIISLGIAIIGALLAFLSAELRYVGIGMVVLSAVGIFGSIIARLVTTGSDGEE